MAINIARFYKREKWEFNCEIITPMFLGNARQAAELRAAPFKGLLRYWWRVANGLRFKNSDLLRAENHIFGGAGDSGRRSQVIVEVAAQDNMIPQKEKFYNPGSIDHPECEHAKGKTNPLNYLAGMGLIKNGIAHSYFPAGAKFSLIISASNEVVEEVQSAINLLNIFGAIGSRCRNGWGSFYWQDRRNTYIAGSHPGAIPSTQDFSAAFEHDYPYCLGRDDKGPLFWKTKEAKSKWENCLKDLAEIYVSIRAGNQGLKIPKLEVNSGNPPDRHLLGYPITHHNKVWGPQGRHASALRLLLRKEEGVCRGYILHLPHLFSKDMWPNGKHRQIDIWRRVHNSLDKLCVRAQFQEAQS